MGEHLPGRLHARGHEHGRPVHRVEPEDVLADEVQGRPVRGEPLLVGPVPGRRDVVRQGVEPHVRDVLRVPRERDPPVERRPADREVPQAPPDQREDLVAADLRLHGRRRPRVVLEQRLRVCGEAEEVVLLAHPLHGASVDGAHPVHELVLGVVGLARDAVQALVRPLVDVVPAVVVHGLEQRGHRGRVPRLRGPDVVVVRDLQPAPHLAPPRLHLVDERLGVLPVRPGPALDVLPVLVGPGEEQDVVAPQAVVPGDEVRGHRRVPVPDVRDVVRVVDRRRDVEGPPHGRVILGGLANGAGSVARIPVAVTLHRSARAPRPRARFTTWR